MASFYANYQLKKTSIKIKGQKTGREFSVYINTGQNVPPWNLGMQKKITSSKQTKTNIKKPKQQQYPLNPFSAVSE